MNPRALREAAALQAAEDAAAPKPPKPKIRVYKGYAIHCLATSQTNIRQKAYWVTKMDGTYVDWCMDYDDGMRLIDRKVELQPHAHEVVTSKTIEDLGGLPALIVHRPQFDTMD